MTSIPRPPTAAVQGGVRWNELNEAAAAHGLAVTGGAISSTGVAGYTLGGGLGWLMATQGLAADNLLGGGTRHGGRRRARRATRHARGPHLGAEGRRWQLRRRHLVRRSACTRSPPSWWRADRPPGRCGARPAPVLPRRGPRRPDDLTVFAGLVHAPDGSGTPLAALVVFHTGTPEEADPSSRR